MKRERETTKQYKKRMENLQMFLGAKQRKIFTLFENIGYIEWQRVEKL